MNHKFSTLIFTLFLIISFGSIEKVLACSCYRNMPCQSYQKADISFFGKVIEKKDVGNNVYKTTFKVYEGYKNIKSGKKVKIYSGKYGGTCGYNFEFEKDYIVFARKSSKRNGFWTGACYGNRRSDYAESYLSKYLKDVSKNGISSMISGIIWEKKNDFDDSFPLNTIKIKAQNINNRNQIFYGKPDKNGYFQIKVTAGKYLVNPEVPKGYTFGTRKKTRKTVSPLIVEKNKCRVIFGSFANDSEINGKLLNSKGLPIRNAYVELISVNYTKKKPNINYEIEKTDENGKFKFKFIPIGKYILGFNFRGKTATHPFSESFYPNVKLFKDAQIIELDTGKKIENIVFQIPNQILNIKIKGKVYGLDNKPIKNAEVFIKDTELNDWLDPSGIKTDKNGKFVIEAFSGRKYKMLIKATLEKTTKSKNYKSASQMTRPFILDEKTKEFKIVLPLNTKDN